MCIAVAQHYIRHMYPLLHILRVWIFPKGRDTYHKQMHTQAHTRWQIWGLLVDWGSILVFHCVWHRLVDPSAVITESDSMIQVSSEKWQKRKTLLWPICLRTREPIKSWESLTTSLQRDGQWRLELFCHFCHRCCLVQIFSIISGPLIKSQRTIPGEFVAEFRFLTQLRLYSPKKTIVIITLSVTKNYLTQGEVLFLPNLVTWKLERALIMLIINRN